MIKAGAGRIILKLPQSEVDSMSVISLFRRKMTFGEKRQSDGAGTSQQDEKRVKKSC